MAAINRAHAAAILSRFVVTTGDEFQGLLHDPTVLPDLLWTIDSRLDADSARVGIGYGRLETPLKTEAIGMDGPAWHHARSAIERAERESRLGGVFEGFENQRDDAVLNGFARLVHALWTRLSKKQRLTVEALRSSTPQHVLARRWRLTKQAVSARARSANWETIQEGENGWRAALAPFAIPYPR